jgi:CNT family concentrative nucleoside transporter
MRSIGLLGIVCFLLIGVLLSRDRTAIDWRTIFWGLGLQWICAVLVLRGDGIAGVLQFLPFPGVTGWGLAAVLVLAFVGRRALRGKKRRLGTVFLGFAVFGVLRGNLVGTAFAGMRGVVDGVMRYAGAGSAFVFGKLADPEVGVFAFSVLPVIIFVSSVFAVLYHLGAMQWVVGTASGVMGQFLKVSGAESVCVGASIFMGQTEAPLTVRPFLSGLTRSEWMTVMTAGMAHVSGSIMVAYVQMAHVDIVHLLTAVVMTAPGAVVMAKLLEPETGIPETSGRVEVRGVSGDANLLDAAARGASEGGQLAFNVGVMLVAFVGLVALVNGVLGALCAGLSLESILAVCFKPVAVLMGVPVSEAGTVGALLGKRMVLNEFVAFRDLGGIEPQALGERGRMIATFALCGFANLSSIAIQVGGIGALVPERRRDLAQLGFRAMLAGTLANFISACIAGVLMA